MNYNTECNCVRNNNTNCSSYSCPVLRTQEYERAQRAAAEKYNQDAWKAVDIYGSKTFIIPNYIKLVEARDDMVNLHNTGSCRVQKVYFHVEALNDALMSMLIKMVTIYLSLPKMLIIFCSK